MFKLVELTEIGYRIPSTRPKADKKVALRTTQYAAANDALSEVLEVLAVSFHRLGCQFPSWRVPGPPLQFVPETVGDIY